MQPLKPSEIEAESMRIIEAEAGPHSFSPEQWQVVRRIIHATADFDIMQTVRFHADAVAAGIQALRDGRPLYVDTAMLAAGASTVLLEKLGCEVLCYIADDDVKQESLATGLTRSVCAMRKAAPQVQGGIIAVGNAPTALHEAISLCEQGAVAPALIIGMPVGFVEARESKERLLNSSCVYLTNSDRKGGTPATAAAINALLQLAEKE